MASGSNSLLKGVFVLLFIAAVFAGLSFLLDPAADDQPPVSVAGPVVGGSSEEAEAREFGAEIGARIGQQVGQRVGELLVANLDVIPDETDDSYQVATAEPASDEEPAEVESISTSNAEQTDTVTAQVIDELTDNSTNTSAETHEEQAAAEPEETAARESIAETHEPEEVEHAPSHTIAVEPAIPAPTPEPAATTAVAETESDPSKNFVFASNGWWSNPGKGLSVAHVGQAASASGFKRSIVVILSAPYKGTQNLESLLKVSQSNGDFVVGTWRRSANARNLLFQVGNAGSYKLHISGQLSSQAGGSLGTDLSGNLSIK